MTCGLAGLAANQVERGSDSFVHEGKQSVGAAAFLVLEDAGLLEQCSVDHYRSSGPGGQKRNKTSSAVRLRHHPTGLSVTASDDRSQRVNMVRAVRRLREAIALHVRAAADPAGYRLSDVLISCIRKGEIDIGLRDAQYFRVMAEVLDVLATFRTRVSAAAKCLGISTAPLVKFIQRDPKLWERANQMRAEAGQRPLR
jgi:hypothetical protein